MKEKESSISGPTGKCQGLWAFVLQYRHNEAEYPSLFPLLHLPFPPPSKQLLLTYFSHLFPGLAGKFIFPPQRIWFCSCSFSLPLKKALSGCLFLSFSTLLESNYQKQGFIEHSLYAAVQSAHLSQIFCLGSSIALCLEYLLHVFVSWSVWLPRHLLQEAFMDVPCPHSTQTPLLHGFLCSVLGLWLFV